MQIAPV
jgi:hypothetical protein